MENALAEMAIVNAPTAVRYANYLSSPSRADNPAAVEVHDGRQRQIAEWQVGILTSTYCCASFGLLARAKSNDLLFNPDVVSTRNSVICMQLLEATVDTQTGHDGALTFKEKLHLYESFRSYVRHEDDLTNNRMTWMLTIHGFLYASYGFTLQKKLEILERINEFVIQNKVDYSYYLAVTRFWFALLEIEVFLLLVAGVGMAISGSALQSVRAASHALSSTRFIFELKFPPFSISRKHGGAISKEEAAAFPVKERDDWLIESVVNIGSPDKDILIPTITGGGHQDLKKGRASAAIVIPSVLFISWIIAILFSAIYFILNAGTIKNLFF